MNSSPTDSSPADSRSNELLLSLVAGIGPRLRKSLLESFGSAASVLDASVGELSQTRGIGPGLARRVAEARQTLDVETELRICQDHGIELLLESDSNYPRLLREIHDPPGVLFLQGELQPQDALAVAVVGTRRATRYGLQQAEQLAAGLARAGVTVVSGLARGIDAAAHRGALNAGGRTLAVMGSGLLRIYPPNHLELAQSIAEQGALLSELPLRRGVQAGSFPQRNRLISGLSLGLLVVEAARRSGALISAGHAAEQGRDVLAVPGPVDQPSSRGCHQLIREGAKLVENVDDILEELGPLVQATSDSCGRSVRHAAELLLNQQERCVLDAIDPSPTPIDHVVQRSQLSVQRVLSTVSVLEMRRLIRRLSGQLLIRV